MTTAQQIIDLAARRGITARLWEGGDQLRLYARTGRKDMTVYLDLDGTAEDVQGATLKVYCATKQSSAWIRSQTAMYRRAYMGLMHAYVVAHYGADGSLDGYGPSIRAMVEEARAAWAAQDVED